ncbi:Na+/H+ antiporter NhaC [Ammoniphilus sp. CFH 90114]|uniref:Na+/H+ antiporter NhaC n=1 Tax=Ammoniphilus sp. CFH 90114 TaxID=2493665 RepID=UPI00100FAD33|nr:Na+/H+ antiporter NhaC [Ammoniphilus sp. CFH 90114]RXT05246.1 Na+/H+ antiporter NhaC [Ammoniphilus sp. CFH 90114]
MGSERREVPFGVAIIPLIVMIAGMAVTIIVFEGSPHIPLILGSVVAALLAWKYGFSWKDIEDGMYKGIQLVLPAVLILIVVGMIIGSWIGGGVISAMTYYGLQLLSPAYFLVAIALICAVVSLAIGSSWSTMATIGVAGMGIGMSMGIPAPMIAGAVISCSYFGDKMSPLSDTTLLASGLSGANLFEHIRHMLYTTIPGLVIALGVYWYLGRGFASDTVSATEINDVMTVLRENFMISPWLLLIPGIVIMLVSRKVPALPALIVGVVLGWIAHVWLQGATMSEAVSALQGGYQLESGNAMVDKLLNRGGIDNMMYTVSLILVAAVFGGVLEHTGMLEAIVRKILKLVKTDGGLMASTVGTSFFTNAVSADQYLSIVVPSRMYAKAYKDRNLHPKNLSRALEDGGTITSVFIPWNTCGVFIFGTLGVSAFAYAPYAVLNFTVPIISIIFSLLGITIVKLKK